MLGNIGPRPRAEYFIFWHSNWNLLAFKKKKNNVMEKVCMVKFHPGKNQSECLDVLQDCFAI